jgi:hypothetical protein
MRCAWCPGKISDATGKHWTMIFIGYGTLIVVPLMGLTTSIPRAVRAVFAGTHRQGAAQTRERYDLSQDCAKCRWDGIVFGLQ